MNKKAVKIRRKIRVIMLTTSFPLSKNSVSGIFIRHLVTHFPESIEVVVLVPGSTYQIKTDINDNFKLVCFRYASLAQQVLTHQAGGLPASLRKNRKSLFLLPVMFLSMLISCLRLARNADIIHANWGINGAVAGIAGYITKTPVVTTLRGTDVKRVQSSILDRLLLKLCFKTNKKIICVSKAIHELITEVFPKWTKKIVTIPNGVGQEFLNIGAPYRKKQSMLKLTSIGSLVTGKGMKTIIKAFAEIKDKRNIRLTIIGDGPEKKLLNDQVAQFGLSGQVSFQGLIPHQKIPEFLKNTDIFILASFSEGRPNVVLEAMAAGVPVIASNIDGVRELICNGENGLLFEPGNSKQLALQIERLKNEPKLRYRLGQAGRNFIIENDLLWENTANHYVKLYKKVIKCAE